MTRLLQRMAGNIVSRVIVGVLVSVILGGGAWLVATAGY